jgi:VanZ family protein
MTPPLRVSRVRIALWLPVFAWMALIFLLSAVPDAVPDDNDEFVFDLGKVAHIIVYAVLSGLVARASGVGAGLVPSVLILAFVALYAISDEIHQGAVPGRTPSVIDMGLDLLGGVLGLIIWHTGRVIHRGWQARRSPWTG